MSAPRLPLRALPLVLALVDAACAARTPPPARTAAKEVAAPAASASASAESSAGPSWERIREEDGIVVDRREVPGSPLIAFRGEGLVFAPLARVAAVLVDVARSPEWVDGVVEARVLRRLGPTEAITYAHVKTPPVLSDRDFVLRGTLTLAPQRVVIAVRSVTDEAMPPGRYVRGEVLDSSFVLTTEADGATRVVAEIHADPKGALPKWLVNAFQRRWAVKTIRGLRAQVKKPDVSEPAWLVTRLSEATSPP